MGGGGSHNTEHYAFDYHNLGTCGGKSKRDARVKQCESGAVDLLRSQHKKKKNKKKKRKTLHATCSRKSKREKWG